MEIVTQENNVINLKKQTLNNKIKQKYTTLYMYKMI